MKMKRFTIITAAAALLSLGAKAQTEVTAYTPGLTEDGITYFLPATSLRVVLTATKTHHTPGEFCEYAERYLRLKDVPQTAYDTWTIDDVKIVPYGVADKSKAYSIKFKQKTSAPYVSLTNDGRLLSVNAKSSVNDEQLPVASVTKVQQKTVNGADFKTEEILSAGSTAKMAELAANEIYDIRENRGLLTKGQADFMPKDGEQLKLMLANLDTQEDGLMQLFRGSASSEIHVVVFDVTPVQDIDRQVVFNFSKYLGVVDADDPAGTPVYISVKDQKSLPEVVAAEANGKAKKEVADLRYATPGRALVKVFSADKEFVSQSVPVAQFGRVEHLGGELFNKKTTTHVQLSPVTGGIVKIEAERPE